MKFYNASWIIFLLTINNISVHVQVHTGITSKDFAALKTILTQKKTVKPKVILVKGRKANETDPDCKTWDILEYNTYTVDTFEKESEFAAKLTLTKTNSEAKFELIHD